MNGKLSKMMYPGKFSAQIVFLVIYYVLMLLEEFCVIISQSVYQAVRETTKK